MTQARPLDFADPDNDPTLHAIWESAADAIAVSDTQGIVRAANPAYYQFYGYTPEEVLGHDFAIIYDPDQRAAAHTDYQAIFVEPEIRPAMVSTVRSKDGTQRSVEVRYTFLIQHGQRTALLSIIRDVTARQQAEAALAERTRLLAFSAAIGRALIESESLPDILGYCAEALVGHLDAAFARIWTLNPADDMLELQASAGLYTHLDGAHSRVPVGAFKIGRIAASRQPHLSNAVQADPEVQNPEWAQRQGLVAFAGYPLLVADRLVGVMALFARHALTPTTLDAMATVADGLAVGIERKQSEEERIRLTVQEQQARAEAELERQRLHDLFMQVPAAVVIYRGPEFIVELINPVFQAMVGGRLQVGQPLLQAMPGLRDSPTYAALEAVYRTGESQSGEEVQVLLDRHGDGKQEETYFNFVTQPTRDLTGQIDGVVVFALDVTAQVLARRQVEELADQRQHALQLRDEFLSIASHELKTPITSIKGLSQLMLRRAPSEASERIRKGLQTITAQSDRLTVLINEVLDVSRLETGQFSIEYDQMDLGALITEVVAEVQLLTDTHVIAVVSPPAPVVLQADQERLRQVLVNLLENGIKYSPAGGPIQVRVEETADQVTVAVQDRGIGIPVDQAEQIFQRFYRARNVTNTRYSGLGLGLYISHAIIDRHGGQLTVESQEGQGTTMAFWLPRHPPAAPVLEQR